MANVVKPAMRIIAGIHAVRSALGHGRGAIETAWYDASRRDRRLGQLLAALRKAGVKLQKANRPELEQLAGGANHQGIVALASAPAALGEGNLDELLCALQRPPFLLVLDHVQDPHNLGACLRSADAAGVHAVIAPRDRAAGLTPAACKVASGAAESVPFVQVTNLARTLRYLRESWGVRVVGTAGEADTLLYEADLTGSLALVMGSEEKGLRRLTREQCDELVRLPMFGVVESLNVSVAAGAALFEAVRQRLKYTSKNSLIR
ncbi:23S rRNA (guanosine(2251)-2'-O)-methyltransferase RlmB [Alcanivorax sp.]|uniref:23S rRNA (guanosine(2251)-2'-O)-methyltransferase RlmB n=1 Tax=Alcanivorax sp. TaxID=1872427 RepID=UPI002586E263|nr:23S rRNA (guanosine(2251)-2'-O)-methyltransferase RlmB [Alcanivorax sp.]